MLKWFGYFLGNTGKHWVTFYTIIWSHWSRLNAGIGALKLIVVYRTVGVVNYSNILSAVVEALSTERWLPTPEDPGSNPAIRNFYKDYLLTAYCIEKMKINKKRSLVPSLKNHFDA